MAKSARSAMRYCLHVELADIKPVVWRKVWVEGQMSLRQLHHILQAAMGWTSSHLHEFRFGPVRYAAPDPDGDPLFDRGQIDDRTVRLDQVLRKGVRFEYMYDFGDDWLHVVRVDDSQAVDESGGVALVDDGDRACPPEDCGGYPGYQAFLDRLAADPGHKEVKSFLAWAGKDFDADRFDRVAANAALLRMAYNRWGEEAPPRVRQGPTSQSE